MRMTSSERSFRLCAFSVLSARICQATSRVGHDERGDRLRAEASHRLEAVAAVRRPERGPPSPLFAGRVIGGDRDAGSRKRPVFSITSARRLWWVSERSRWKGVGSTLSMGGSRVTSGWPPSGSLYRPTTMPPSCSMIFSSGAIVASFASSRHDSGSSPADPAFCLRGVRRFGAFDAARFFAAMASFYHSRVGDGSPRPPRHRSGRIASPLLNGTLDVKRRAPRGGAPPSSTSAEGPSAPRLRAALTHSLTRSRASLRVHLDARRRGEGHPVRLVPVGVAYEHVAVGEQRVLPVAARRARAEELLLDDPLAALAHARRRAPRCA